MPRFRLLYFRESVLDHAEEVVARDVLEAIEVASGKPPDLRVEVWSNERRVAEVGVFEHLAQAYFAGRYA